MHLPHDGGKNCFPPLPTLVGAFVVLAGLAAVFHRSGGQQREKAGSFFGCGNRTERQDGVDELVVRQLQLCFDIGGIRRFQQTERQNRVYGCQVAVGKAAQGEDEE